MTAVIVAAALVVWVAVSVAVGVKVGRVIRLRDRQRPGDEQGP